MNLEYMKASLFEISKKLYVFHDIHIFGDAPVYQSCKMISHIKNLPVKYSKFDAFTHWWELKGKIEEIFTLCVRLQPPLFYKAF